MAFGFGFRRGLPRKGMYKCGETLANVGKGNVGNIWSILEAFIQTFPGKSLTKNGGTGHIYLVFTIRGPNYGLKTISREKSANPCVFCFFFDFFN